MKSKYCKSYERLIDYRKSQNDSLAIVENKDKSRTMIETLRKRVKATVRDSPKCTCRGYERDGAPCRHILALAERRRVKQSVSRPCYLSSTIINALTDVSQLEVANVKMLPPKRLSGRPPPRQYKSAAEHLFEHKKKYRCAICHQTGHTAKTHDAWVRPSAHAVQGR